ncbi:kinase-like domain-containing protein [Glomus cerebriforme]|uniref:Kinase-like domain-containing protein n=1 Tax=Glomus cerebriforme TaxID=658196 RepID=A0A397T386_9GLOM|nr:kinase-like domain-containing protein [Glomus cerebriforme]
MSAIREEIVRAALNRSYALMRSDINDIHKKFEFRKQTILADNFLTEDEKTEAIGIINETYDRNKVLFNEGTKRICENCNQECLATLYCEYCVRNYLKAKFSNWTSGNDDIDNLIRKCQMETLRPDMIVEWIPYNNFQNIKYLTKGGYSEIYTADWIDGGYYRWDFEEQQLKRFGGQKVIIKRLENVENASHNWFEEAKSHSTISNKWPDIVPCYGLTQDPSNGDYMLVMDIMDVNLREYLQQNHNQLTWKKRIQITFDIIDALDQIHEENAIHRDLHSGNILHSPRSNRWFISDLGFCGPADKSAKNEMNRLYQTESNELIKPKANSNSEVNKQSINYASSRLFTSKVHQFENLPEPRNATEEFHIKSYNDYHIPDNIDDFVDNLNNQKNDHSSKKRSGIFKDPQNDYNNKETMQNHDDKEVHNNPNLHSGLTKNIKNLQIKNDSQHDYNNKATVNRHAYIDDDNEVYNNPNLHSDEQDELEIPEDINFE